MTQGKGPRKPKAPGDTPHHKPKKPRYSKSRGKSPDDKAPGRSAHKNAPRGRGGNSSHVPNVTDQKTPAEISVLIIKGTTAEGEPTAIPAKWESKYEPPQIVVIESGRAPAVSQGDRVLARLRKVAPHLYQALIIRILPEEQKQTVLGVFVPTPDGGLIEPISRKMKESFLVASGDTNGALRGELVSGVTLPGMPSLSMTFAKITERLGRLDAPRAASLIASHMHDLPSVFSEAAIAESEEASSPILTKDRVDLRDIPLVTIDGEDARDFDDAVFAERDGNGWHLIVAIADVAFYVKEGSALDQTAVERGNSVYFPDRVIPMLPERLSNGLCSLKPDEDRYCLAVHLWIDSKGSIQRYQFVRGLMCSRARLTYNTAQSIHNTRHPGESGNDEINEIVANLYGAYEALAYERDNRGSLDLNLPEYKILFDDKGSVTEIAPRERLESHRLIECYMIAANVAAADYLLAQNAPGLYRVHEPPAEEKLEELKKLLKMAGFGLHVGAGIKAAHFNRVLKAVQGAPEEYLVNTAILRSQMQAYYSHECLGHFGLSLQKYTHFTSPIRRYSDLVVHRSLAAIIAGEHPKNSPATNTRLAEIALHISETERRAMLAERDASDRYKVAYMVQHIGATFAGTIVSLNEYGLFVSLNATGVTGFIPVRNLKDDFYTYDRSAAAFRGQRSKHIFQIGNPLFIRVQQANPITGSLIFELAGGSESVPNHPLRTQRKDAKHKHRPNKEEGLRERKKNRGKNRNKGKSKKPKTE